MNSKTTTYEVKNGWIFCEVCVVDRRQNEMGINPPNEWNRIAYKISSIHNFRDCSDDEDYENCCTIYDGYDSFTITVPFDDLCRIIFEEH